ncbi:uncharacterized protein LOC119608472 [Lucilia sericata]|uniref:uncharacterized protein LOC119608472 n=1 Tax=Lucilia sericata TaxID=13632 RepID=UPI0018A85EAF|nr:uncharacterized protein LOC119608472 [Lucilia sericata]
MNISILFEILSFLFIVDLVSAIVNKNSWIYELNEVNAKSSNPDLLNFNVSIERIKRGVFALSGEFYLNIDITEGDGNDVELKSFRSANGDGNYKSIPFDMSRRHFYEALNSHYKNVVMDTFKDCSDLPYFEDKFSPPLEKKTYILDKCQFSQDGLPNHMERGLYKIVLTGYGQVDWELEVIFEIELNFG